MCIYTAQAHTYLTIRENVQHFNTSVQAKCAQPRAIVYIRILFITLQTMIMRRTHTHTNRYTGELGALQVNGWKAIPNKHNIMVYYHFSL